MTEQHLTDKTFADFDLPASLLQGLEDAGFSKCTPIQARTLPVALAGHDVAGQAQTGTGKTAAFLLATMTRLLRSSPDPKRKPNQPRALILAPTRELAIQIEKDAELLGKHTGLKRALIYGGTDYDKQRDSLAQGCDILIGTPGRIIDFFKQHVFDLRAIEVVVLDEADRMFDLGFIKDIRFLLRRTPKPEERQGLLFSATLSYRVMELAYEHMNNPEQIVIETETVTADRVTQLVYHTANEEKIPLLLGLMKHGDPSRSIVFTNTKRAAEKVWGYLEGNGIHAALLSGDVPQKKRQRLLAEFTEGKLAVLVATDVAARGLHIPSVSHVFNFDLPDNAEDYVHRIGRTARAGESGDAISFACETYAFNLMDIEEFIEHKLPVGTVEPGMLLDDIQPPVRVERIPRPARGDKSQRGHRGSGRRGTGKSSSRRPSS
ncbi:MAG: ATP-dependent RNA helicase RhlB [Granulosicoccaceae bacterium]|jgi:ATP-dependent RNA helicase RhlB